ncbi:Arc family DNA-binding protein [Pseudomonas chlororaphis]|uniref:Arc-like DNA binding domain protein n=1 Tax=Pseudomonas chlororaphis O6 TaxID=1037915 RepID=A0AB33WLT8_9PSED|nr:Arc family DNA-binding protein [Pseudomonas chlororaphis]EIM13942.1 Arc-like DNA binding domain protein [Pseudomonas chlororaphis O6]
MSRTDLQVNFRMPAELKAELERAAKESGRSLTAEVVARLDLSLLADGKSPEAFFTAEEAMTYASVARKSIPAIVRERIRVSINRSIVRGLNAADVQLRDLGLESLPSEELAKIQFELSHELNEAGYKFEWDGGDSIWITYGDEDSAPDIPDIEIPAKRDTESLESQRRLILKRIRKA